MGIGNLGFDNLIFKRKFRFTFELSEICGKQTVPPHYVKVAARPNLTIEETELNYLHAKTWVPGKAYWESLNVIYYDVASIDMEPLYNWLASVYDFLDPVTLKMGTKKSDYSAKALLKMWTGCGELIDQWELKNVWPTSINFGDVDYSSSDISEIELSLRYSDAKYTSVCPKFNIKNCCTPC